jgi:hypothetical protein
VATAIAVIPLVGAGSAVVAPVAMAIETTVRPVTSYSALQSALRARSPPEIG